MSCDGRRCHGVSTNKDKILIPDSHRFQVLIEDYMDILIALGDIPAISIYIKQVSIHNCKREESVREYVDDVMLSRLKISINYRTSLSLLIRHSGLH